MDGVIFHIVGGTCSNGRIMHWQLKIKFHT